MNRTQRCILVGVTVELAKSLRVQFHPTKWKYFLNRFVLFVCVCVLKHSLMHFMSSWILISIRMHLIGVQLMQMNIKMNLWIKMHMVAGYNNVLHPIRIRVRLRSQWFGLLFSASSTLMAMRNSILIHLTAHANTHIYATHHGGPTNHLILHERIWLTFNEFKCIFDVFKWSVAIINWIGVHLIEMQLICVN